MILVKITNFNLWKIIFVKIPKHLVIWRIPKNSCWNFESPQKGVIGGIPPKKWVSKKSLCIGINFETVNWELEFIFEILTAEKVIVHFMVWMNFILLNNFFLPFDPIFRLTLRFYKSHFWMFPIVWEVNPIYFAILFFGTLCLKRMPTSCLFNSCL